MPERVAQVEDPAAIPAPERRMGPPQFGTGAPDLAQVAGALAALARRVEAQERPKVTMSDRKAALEAARDFVAELGTRPRSEGDRIASEVAVARYLTGE